jgi:hypothetical protein
VNAPVFFQGEDESPVSDLRVIKKVNGLFPLYLLQGKAQICASLKVIFPGNLMVLVPSTCFRVRPRV